MKLDEFIKHVEREREAQRLTNAKKIAIVVNNTKERTTTK
jgi:hypothetical protein